MIRGKSSVATGSHDLLPVYPVWDWTVINDNRLGAEVL